MNEIKSCAFTGHRPNKLYGYDLNTKEYELLSQELIKVIKVLIEEKGVTRFISGGALGFDTIAYICVDFLKKQYKDIKNILAIPFENQYVKWNTMDKERYFKMKEFADEVIYVDTLENYKTDNNVKEGIYSFAKMQFRNEYMVDNSDYLVALWDGNFKSGTYNCIKYAKTTHTKDNIIVINPQTRYIDMLH